MSCLEAIAIVPEEAAAKVREYFLSQEKKMADLEKTVTELQQKLKDKEAQHAATLAETVADFTQEQKDKDAQHKATLEKTVADLTLEQRDKDAKHAVDITRLQGQLNTLKVTFAASLKNLAQRLEFEKSVNEHNMWMKKLLSEVEHRFVQMFNQAGETINRAAIQLWNNFQNELKSQTLPGPTLIENSGGTSSNSAVPTTPPMTAPFFHNESGSDDGDVQFIKKVTRTRNEESSQETAKRSPKGRRNGRKRASGESKTYKSKQSKSACLFDEATVSERRSSLRSSAKKN